MNMKVLYAVSILLFAVSSFAAEQIELSGKYQGVGEVCSDGSDIYESKLNRLKTGPQVILDFLDNETVKTTTIHYIDNNKDQFTTSFFVAKYTMNAENEFKYTEVIDFDFPDFPEIKKIMLEGMIFFLPAQHIIIVDDVLYWSYREDPGRFCKSPAFKVDIFKKVD